MAIRERYVRWGIFLVCLGIVPLAAQVGLIEPNIAAGVLRLWPLILIAIGLGLVVRMTRYHLLGSVISAAIVGLAVGVVFAGGVSSPAFMCGGGQPNSAPVTQTGSFNGSSAGINIELTCGEIDLSRGASPGWSVAVASDGTNPVVRGDADTLDLRSADPAIVGSFAGGTHEHWQVTLPTATTVSAGVTLNAASGRLAFGNGEIGHVSTTYNGADSILDLRGVSGDSSISSTLNASSVRLLLPETPIQASVTLNASSLTVCVPPTVGLRLGYSNVLGGDNLAAAGLQGAGESWYTPELPIVSTLHVTSNLSSLTLDRSGECQ